MRTVKAKISVAASVGSALVLSATQVMSSGASISISSNIVSSSSNTFWNSSNIQRSSLSLNSVVHQKWSAQANIRFKELARKDAMDELTAREWAELDSLSDLRRQAKFPLSADQILWQRKQKSVTQNLLNAIKEYVEFHDFPG
jgi:hypothetical protein